MKSVSCLCQFIQGCGTDTTFSFSLCLFPCSTKEWETSSLFLFFHAFLNLSGCFNNSCTVCSLVFTGETRFCLLLIIIILFTRADISKTKLTDSWGGAWLSIWNCSILENYDNGWCGGGEEVVEDKLERNSKQKIRQCWNTGVSCCQGPVSLQTRCAVKLNQLVLLCVLTCGATGEATGKPSWGSLKAQQKHLLLQT